MPHYFSLRHLIVSSVLCLCANAFAEPADHYSSEFTIMGGQDAVRLNTNTFVAVSSAVTNTYNTTVATKRHGVAGLDAHRVFYLSPHVKTTIGPSVYYLNLGKINGIESPFSNGNNFDTLNYQFFGQSYLLLLQSTLGVDIHHFNLFVVGGIGAAWNKFFNYSEVPTNPSSGISAASSVFQNSTQSDFAYELGAGFSCPVLYDKKHDMLYSLGLQYRYFNMGSGRLSASAVQTNNQSLQVNTIDAQSVLVGITAAFDY